ncbi:hypothetical protein ACHQM5_000265 [Ranunculus cassubicifolius]
MVKIAGTCIPLMFSVIFVVSFPILAKSQTPLIGIAPQSAGEDLQHCWASLKSVNGCVTEIYTSFITGRAGSLGPACCKAITETQSNCWPKMFPFNPFLAPLLTNYCSYKPLAILATAPASAPVSALSTIAPATTGLVYVNQLELDDARKCLLSLSSTLGCADELISSYLSNQFRLISPKCCKAVTKISQNCLPKIFPFSTLFSTVVQNFCRNFVHLKP